MTINSQTPAWATAAVLVGRDFDVIHAQGAVLPSADIITAHISNARWLEGRRGQKFGAGELVREFPELDGTPISIFLKPLVESGKVRTDTSEGIRRTKYFVEG